MGVQFAGNILVQANGGPLPISAGGTGQTTAPTAINALLPLQTGQSGKYLKSDGTNVSWASSTGGTPGGSDTQIQYNDSGTFGGGAFLTINKSTGAVTSTSTLKSVGLFVSDIAGSFRTLHYQTAGSDRWLVQANNTTEAGANSGSDFELVRVADNGATQNIAFSVARSSGVVDFKATPTVNGTPIGSGAGTVTSVQVSGGTTGLTAAGGPITSSGTITLGGTLALANGGTGATTQSGAANAVLPTQTSQSGKYLTTNGSTVSWASVPAAGVTSVAMSVPAFLSVSGSPITTSGTLAVTLSGTALPVANGGTGSTTANTAFNTLVPSQVTNSGKFLTTDGTNTSWISPVSGTSLQATGLASVNTSVTGTYAGLDGNGFPIIALVNASAPTNKKYSEITVDPTTGNTNFQLLDDGNLTSGIYMSVARTGTTATNITLTGTAITLSGAVSGTSFSGNGASLTSLNASNLSTGTVNTARLGSGTADNTTFLRGDNTWQIISTGGTGTVTSIQVASGGTNSGALSVSGGPITSNGTITITPNVFTNTVAGVVSASGGGTSNFLRADGTWATPTTGIAAAGTLTGATLASNVINSSLSSVGTISTGTWSASFGAVSGANLTTLNASNLSSGTVPTAQLGSGTANSTTFLRGDNTWASPSVTSLQGTTNNNVSTTTTGAYAGLDTVNTNQPAYALSHASAAANNRLSEMTVTSTGRLDFALLTDASAGIPWMSVTRSSNVATLITTASTGVNLTGLTAGLQLNGSAGTTGQILTSQGPSAAPTWTTAGGSGTVTSVAVSSATAAITISGSPVTTSGTITITPNVFTTTNPGVVGASGGGTTNFLRADGGWAAPSVGSSSSLNGTGAYISNAALSGSSSPGVYAGAISTVPVLGHYVTGAGVGQKYSSHIATTAGLVAFQLISDDTTANNTWLSVSRNTVGSAATAPTPLVVTMTGATINHTGMATGGFQINGSAGTSGQVLTSQGAAAAPIWSAISLSTAATNIAGGVAGSMPWQSAASTTGFTAAGTSGALLQSNGTSVPTWTQSPTITGLLTTAGVQAYGTSAFTVPANAGVHIGADNGGFPTAQFYSSGAGTDAKISRIYVNASGSFIHDFINDANSSATNWMKVDRTGTTATTIAFTGTAFTTSGFISANPSLTAALGATAGSIYSPITAISINSIGLKAPSTVNSGGSSGVSIGASSSDSSSQIQMYDSGATTGGRGLRFINWQNNFQIQFMADDCVSSGNTFLSVTRTAGSTTITGITLTSPTVTASAALVATTTMTSPTYNGAGPVTLTTGGTGNALTINTPAGANTGAISIIPGTSSTSTVGAVTITGGATSATSQTGGPVNITGGAGTGTTAIGGTVNITAGAGTQTGGNITITAANSTANPGGSVTIKGGNTGTSGIGGDIVVTPGAGSGGNPAGALTLGVGSLAQAAAGGFPYMPLITVTAAGTPNGTPTAKSGFAPFAFDSTNNKLWIWNGAAWKGVVLA